MDGLLDARNLARLKSEQHEYWLHLEAGSTLDKYPAKQHARRVQEKLGVDDGLIYLPGERQRNNEDSDMPAAFRQRRYFYYLSGCNEPDCHLTYDIENDSLALFIPRIDPARVIWNGRGSTPAEALDKYDIDQVFYIDQLEEFLREWARFYRGSLYILHPSNNPLIPGIHEPVDSVSLQPAMNLARVVKDEHEIRLIKKANDISSQAHKEILANILNFKNEAQVEGLFLDVCVSKRAKQQAYDIIAASGAHAGTLHYDDNDADFKDSQLMCLDAGCEYALYASDITRTFPLSGNWPSVEAKNVYQLVQRMQETCIQGLKPGVRYLDLHILAHQIAIDGLLALGILHNGTREEIYKAGTSKAFFPHGLGHHVGLEVHDPGQGDLMSMTKGNPKYEMAPSIFPQDFHLPVYDPKLCRSPVDVLSGHLEQGMIVTVEPGIYFSPYALKEFYLPSPIHSKYINFNVVLRYLPVGGVRIEDDILITSKGYENLTTAPKGEAMLEIIRSRNAQWPFVSDSADLGPILKETLDVRKEGLLRAPGFPKNMPEPIPRHLSRASTSPIKKIHDWNLGAHADPKAHFEIFGCPKRSRTTDENVQHWKAAHGRPTLQKISDFRPLTTLCGEESPTFTHAYLEFPAADLHLGPPFLQTHATGKKPVCKKCKILLEAVHRLRENLNKSEQGSPQLDTKVEPTSPRKIPEMEQLGSSWKATPIITPFSSGKGAMLGNAKTDIQFTAEPLQMPIRTSQPLPTLYDGFNPTQHSPAPHPVNRPKLSPIPRTEISPQRPESSTLFQRINPLYTQTNDYTQSSRVKAPSHVHPFSRAPISRASLPILPSEKVSTEVAKHHVLNPIPPKEISTTFPLPDSTSTNWSQIQFQRVHQHNFQLKSVSVPHSGTFTPKGCQNCVKNGFKCGRVKVTSPPCLSCTEQRLRCEYVEQTPLPTSNESAISTTDDPNNQCIDERPLPRSNRRSKYRIRACALCRMRMMKCNRPSPDAPCSTCSDNGYLCPDAPAAAPLLKLGAVRPCDSCSKARRKCVDTTPYGSCSNCEMRNVPCEHIMNKVMLAKSEQERAQLLELVNSNDQKWPQGYERA